MKTDPKVTALLEQWSSFVATREAERHRLTNPPGLEEKRAELVEAQQELARLKGKVQLLKAELTVSAAGENYSKPLFDSEWAAKKVELKDQCEVALMGEISSGKSIPTIMHEYNLSNPAWLYRIRDRMNHHTLKEAAKVRNAEWFWSDFTGTHRFALALGDEGTWKYVKMMGALESDLEGEYAVWDAENGDYIAGSKEVFESDTPQGKMKRKNLLAAVLDGSYNGVIKESPNPYFGDGTS